jgi:ABC-2 type transport system ATP-binding protein
MSATQEYPSGVCRDATASDYAITSVDLERSFGNNVALAGLNIAVEPGDIYGFLGPNGAGKSTFIRILCTLLLPSGGTATVAGHNVVDSPQAVRHKMGVALQSAGLDERATGRELLQLQARLYGLDRAARRRRLDEVLDLVNIGAAVDRRISGYSGGMKRRLDLAAALIHGPEVLLLDEPTTGLDPPSRQEVWGEVRRLNQEIGLTVLLTTQYLEEADALAGRVGIIRDGRLVAEGSPADLKRLVGNELIVMETDGHTASQLDRLRRMGPPVVEVSSDGCTLVVKSEDATATMLILPRELARANIQVRSLRLHTPTLEDVFRHWIDAKAERAASVA